MQTYIVDKLCDSNFKPSSRFALPAALPVDGLSPERANAMQALSIRIMSQAEAQLGNPDVTAEKIRSIGFVDGVAATHELRIRFPEAQNTNMGNADGPTRAMCNNAEMSVVPIGTELPADGETRAATPQEKRVYCEETVRILRMRGQIWVGAANAAIKDNFPGNNAVNQNEQAAQAQQQAAAAGQVVQPTMQQLQDQIAAMQAQLAQQGQGQGQVQGQGQGQVQGQGQGQGQGQQQDQGQGGRRRKKRKTKNKKKKRRGRKTNKKQHKKKHHKKKGKRKTVKKHHKKKGKRKTRKY